MVVPPGAWSILVHAASHKVFHTLSCTYIIPAKVLLESFRGFSKLGDNKPNTNLDRRTSFACSRCLGVNSPSHPSLRERVSQLITSEKRSKRIITPQLMERTHTKLQVDRDNIWPTQLVFNLVAPSVLFNCHFCQSGIIGEFVIGKFASSEVTHACWSVYRISQDIECFPLSLFRKQLESFVEQMRGDDVCEATRDEAVICCPFVTSRFCCFDVYMLNTATVL